MTVATRKYDRVDVAWLALLVVVGSAVSVVLAASFFDFTVFMSGILCVGLTAIGRREGYLIGLYNSLSYSVLAYSNGLYGEVYLNLLFFVPTGIIGYLLWQLHTMQDGRVAMRQMLWLTRAVIAVICIACTVGLGLLLRLNPNQNTPFIDASTNVLSVVATFLMMWRYKEQWLLYIVLNIVSVFMWTLRLLAGGTAGDMMVLMWSAFLLNAVFGYWRWHVGAATVTVARTNQVIGGVACDVA